MNSGSSETFFVAGGTLNPESPSYVKRAADDELFKLVQEGEFCYVLTPRQLGKSSLMARTSQRLRQVGVRTAIIDLTQIGTDVAPEAWYLGLLTELSQELLPDVDLTDWWQANSDVSVVQRFTDFLLEVLLVQIQDPVTIFIDEIDSTLSLDFSDDFFAAIRAVYNGRSTHPVYERLTFVLLGVATPADLMKDRSRTPFNIGKRVELQEFSRSEAQVLQDGLEDAISPEGAAVFDRIFYWTDGHPYLTQKLCLTAIKNGEGGWSDDRLDNLVTGLFLSDEAGRESNLQFVRSSIASSQHKRPLLQLYQQVYRGERVAEDERSLLQNELKLIGLVEARDGLLTLRNEIYRQAFDEEWIQDNMPADRNRRIAALAVIGVVLLSILLVFVLQQQSQRSEEALAQEAVNTFQSSGSPSVQLNALATLIGLGSEYQDQARNLVASLPVEQRLLLFSQETNTLGEARSEVARTIYVTLSDHERDRALLEAMLATAAFDDDLLLEKQIEQWLHGRQAYADGSYEDAVEAFDSAIEYDSQHRNPAIYFDRALVKLSSSEVDYAVILDDLEMVLVLANDQEVTDYWTKLINDEFKSHPELARHFEQKRSQYPSLESAVP